jgi:hypothetical protein
VNQKVHSIVFCVLDLFPAVVVPVVAGVTRQEDVFAQGMKIYLSCSQVATETGLIRTRLGRLDRVFVVDRSTLGARSGPLDQVIISELTRSDLFIGVFGPDCEIVDANLGVSLCEFEYREALLLGIPRLLYIESDFAMEPEAAVLRHLIEKNDLPVLFRATPVLTTQIVTDVYNFTFRDSVEKTSDDAEVVTKAGSPAPSGSEQSIKDPEPIEWYRSWKNWFAKNIFPRSPVLRSLLQAVLIPLITVAAVFKIYGVPQPIGDSVAKVNADTAIVFGSSPRHYHEPIHDSFDGASLDTAKWDGGANWKLIGVDSPNKHDTLSITGNDIGFLKVPDRFESYYDIALSFQVPILKPAAQKSLAWLVRLEHSWRGNSYYRFNLTFPTADDQHLHLTASLYDKGIFNRSIGERSVQFSPFVRTGSTLNITTTLSGSNLNVAVRYSDACVPPCAQYNDGTEHIFVFDDPQHTLKWGLVGFTNSEGNAETDIQNLDLIPVGGKDNAN